MSKDRMIVEAAVAYFQHQLFGFLRVVHETVGSVSLIVWHTLSHFVSCHNTFLLGGVQSTRYKSLNSHLNQQTHLELLP